MIRSYMWSALFIFCSLVQASTPSYSFYGRHFIASYKECDPQALQNVSFLKAIFEKAVQSSGATILKHDWMEFSGNGLTGVFLLSESHASIHTYPEHNACFVDLFTCGYACSYEPFDRILSSYLKPKKVDKQLCTRS